MQYNLMVSKCNSVSVATDCDIFTFVIVFLFVLPVYVYYRGILKGHVNL